VQHRGGGGGSMVANHRSGSESSMVVTTLMPVKVSNKAGDLCQKTIL